MGKCLLQVSFCLDLVLIYCLYLQPCKERALNCASLSLAFELYSDGDELVCRKPESIPWPCKLSAFAFIICTEQEPQRCGQIYISFPAIVPGFQQFSEAGIGRVWAIMSRCESSQQWTMLQHYHKLSQILQHRKAFSSSSPSTTRQQHNKTFLQQHI